MRRAAWGKTDMETGGVHPLAHHSMDVAAVFSRMLQLPSIRDRLETAAGTPLTNLVCRRLAALAFLGAYIRVYPKPAWPTRAASACGSMSSGSPSSSWEALP